MKTNDNHSQWDRRETGDDWIIMMQCHRVNWFNKADVGNDLVNLVDKKIYIEKERKIKRVAIGQQLAVWYKYKF